ncbi:MAG: zinc-ribbon domain-containing protein [Pseudolysinimonas sp.]
MTCRYCGTTLPDRALFCGECGQPVAAAPSTQQPQPATTGFSIADLAFSSPGDISEPDDDDRELPDEAPSEDADPASPTESELAMPSPTQIIMLPDLIRLGEFPADPAAPDPHDGERSDGLSHDADSTTEVEPLVDGADGFAEIDDLVLEPAPASGEPEEDSDPEDENPHPFVSQAAKAGPSPRSRPTPDPFPWGTDTPLREDLEATRLVSDSASGTRYVLQFSTGESVTVAGSGLVGRNPSMQPGEYVDQLVPIFDASKSVSKTHLEFGQEAGRFWVSDRYSTNGSVIRQPDAEPRRCDAGRRYFIARGTRVDVGEQFFVVS